MITQHNSQLRHQNCLLLIKTVFQILVPKTIHKSIDMFSTRGLAGCLKEQLS